MSEPKQEVCTIRILFPVVSDEQAIDFKKKIAVMLKDIPDVQLHFAIMPEPHPNPMR